MNDCPLTGICMDMITDPQIAFAVKQGSLITVEVAVTATLRMESYRIKSFKAAPVHLIDEAATSIGGRTMESTVIRAVGERREEDPTVELLDRVERMEAREHEKMPSCPNEQQYWDRRDRGQCRQRGTWNKTTPREDSAFRGGERNPVVYHRCRQEGHYARGCAVRRPGNSGPF